MSYNSEFQERKIIIPPDVYRIYGSPKSSDKIIIKLINTECVSCFKDMIVWVSFLRENKNYKDVRVIMLAAGEANDYFQSEIIKQQYPFEIWMDTTKDFLKLNKLPGEFQFATFMINSDSLSVMLGSPIVNETIKGIYDYLIDTK